MKKITSALALTAAVALANQAAQAQVTPGDLVLGFTSPTATTDYVVDLGNLSSFSTTSITQLGSLISGSQFTTGGAFPTGISGVNVGAFVGVGNSGPGDFAGLTTLRLGNNAAGVAGTESAPAQPPTGTLLTQAATSLNSLTTGTPLVGSQTSFTSTANTLTPGTAANELGRSPLFTVSGSGIAEDIFESTRGATTRSGTASTPFTYIGQLDLDLSGSSPSLEFVPAGFSAVPEPGTYGLLAGAGLLAMAFRRQFNSKNA